MTPDQKRGEIDRLAAAIGRTKKLCVSQIDKDADDKIILKAARAHLAQLKGNGGYVKALPHNNPHNRDTNPQEWLEHEIGVNNHPMWKMNFSELYDYVVSLETPASVDDDVIEPPPGFYAVCDKALRKSVRVIHKAGPDDEAAKAFEIAYGRFASGYCDAQKQAEYANGRYILIMDHEAETIRRKLGA